MTHPGEATNAANARTGLPDDATGHGAGNEPAPALVHQLDDAWSGRSPAAIDPPPNNAATGDAATGDAATGDAATGDAATGDAGEPDDMAETGPASRTERLATLGGQIRALRGERRLSATALARRCGVSPSLISQVERGLTSPSLDVLWAIARALDTPIGAFFQSSGDDPDTIGVAAGAGTGAGLGGGESQPARVQVVRANRRKILGLTPTFTYQLLSPDLQHRIEFVLVELGPGDEGPREPFTHAGEEQLTVISGELIMWIDGVEWLLHEGDTITFDSALPHRAINRGPARAVAISAGTPPSF